MSGVTRAINSATPSQGSCAIAPPTVTCTLVDLAARPHLDVLVPYLRYTLTARDLGPDAVTCS